MPAARQIKPLIVVCVSEALRLLPQSSLPDEEEIHEIRVLMKKARALLKLTAGQVDEKFYAGSMEAFKMTGKLLAELRERTVIRRTFKEIRKKHRGVVSRLNDNPAISGLAGKTGMKAVESSMQADRIANLRSMLTRAGYRLRFEPMSTLNGSILYKELENTYLAVSAVYLKCRNRPKPADIHRLRKRAKDLMYQLYVFRPAGRSAIKKCERMLEVMTANLGRFRDLAQFIKAIDYNYSPGNSNPDLDALVVLIRGMEDKCMSKAWNVADRIFLPGCRLPWLPDEGCNCFGKEAKSTFR